MKFQYGFLREEVSFSPMGRSLHCKVEQPRVNTLHVKTPTLYIKHLKMGQTFINFTFMSRYT